MELNKFEYNMLRAMYTFFDDFSMLPCLRVNQAIMHNKALSIDYGQRERYEMIEKLLACCVLEYTDKHYNSVTLFDHDMARVLMAEYEAKVKG